MATTLLNPHQWHEAAQAQGLQVFALVDGCAGPAKRQRWRGLHDSREVNLFEPRSGDPRALEIAPRLHAAAAQPRSARALLERYAEQSTEQAYASLIATPLTLDELATRLSRRIDADAAGLPMLLRLWDPRVLRVLPQALAPETQAAILAFGVQALVPNRTGGHEVVALSCPAEDPLLAQPGVRLGQSELDALLRATHPDALLGALREQDEAIINAVPDAQRYPLALSQSQACEAHGFTGPQDQLLALSLAIEHGEHWWREPRWAGCLQQAKATSLVEAYRAQQQQGAA